MGLYGPIPLNPAVWKCHSPVKISIERDLSRKEKEENLIKKRQTLFLGFFEVMGFFWLCYNNGVRVVASFTSRRT